jgi:ferrochelatase
MISEYLPAGEFNKKTAHIIFSAHGLPIDIIEKGDPYLKQTQITFENICEKLPFECGKHLAFQSRTGPAKWLEPDSVNVIKNLASKGARTIGIVPISFVAENLETLYDQDIVLRQTAFASGIADYYRVPAFDGDGRFIKCLKQLVLENE